MAAPDPKETHQIFQHDRVAAGYASARPYLHPEVFAVLRDVVGPEARFRRALDVGCGTGLSSVALLDRGLARPSRLRRHGTSTQRTRLWRLPIERPIVKGRTARPKGFAPRWT